MIGLLLAAALVAALAASGVRVLRRSRRRRALAALPGGSRASAIPVDGFPDIDSHVAARRCPCGGSLQRLGERSESGPPAGATILRVVRVECRRCEEIGEVWFDATLAYH